MGIIITGSRVTPAIPADRPEELVELSLMKAIGYVRVSTDKQADSGLGLEAQPAAVTAAAHRLGVTLGAVHVDAAVSGSLSNGGPAGADGGRRRAGAWRPAPGGEAQ